LAGWASSSSEVSEGLLFESHACAGFLTTFLKMWMLSGGFTCCAGFFCPICVVARSSHLRRRSSSACSESGRWRAAQRAWALTRAVRSGAVGLAGFAVGFVTAGVGVTGAEAVEVDGRSMTVSELPAGDAGRFS